MPSELSAVCCSKVVAFFRLKGFHPLLDIDLDIVAADPGRSLFFRFSRFSHRYSRWSGKIAVCALKNATFWDFSGLILANDIETIKNLVATENRQ